MGQPVARAQEEELRFAALQELVDQRLMLQAAKRERIRVDNKLVNQEFNALQEAYGDQFNTVLRMQGLNHASLRELIRENLLLQKVREEKSKVVVTDEEVREAFDREREEIEVRHILIDPWEEELGGDWDAAQQKAEEILERLRPARILRSSAAAYSADPGIKRPGRQPRLRPPERSFRHRVSRGGFRARSRRDQRAGPEPVRIPYHSGD